MAQGREGFVVGPSDLNLARVAASLRRLGCRLKGLRDNRSLACPMAEAAVAEDDVAVAGGLSHLARLPRRWLSGRPRVLPGRHRHPTLRAQAPTRPSRLSQVGVAVGADAGVECTRDSRQARLSRKRRRKRRANRYLSRRPSLNHQRVERKRPREERKNRLVLLVLPAGRQPDEKAVTCALV